MVHIEIVTTEEEQSIVIEALKHFKGKTVAITAVAKQAKMNPNRVRYVVADLIELGKVKKVPTKAFNAHYVRYKYEVV